MTDGPVEFPEGLNGDQLDTMWPFNATRQEMWDGCPHWDGGPYTAADCDRAERLLLGWTALVGVHGYGMTLCPPIPARIDAWIAQGYGRPIELSPETQAKLKFGVMEEVEPE